MRDQDITWAESVISAADTGTYDAQLGISPEERDLLTRANGAGPLSMNDVHALAEHNRHDLISAAYDAGRIALTEGDHS